jgi:hypothetical protein
MNAVHDQEGFVEAEYDVPIAASIRPGGEQPKAPFIERLCNLDAKVPVTLVQLVRQAYGISDPTLLFPSRISIITEMADIHLTVTSSGNGSAEGQSIRVNFERFEAAQLLCVPALRWSHPWGWSKPVMRAMEQELMLGVENVS